MSGCYNVTIDCHSGDMTANILTSALFNGKIYAKGSPVKCMEDVSNSLEFSITMGYNDIDCAVDREGPGIFSNEVIIQHHDRIVTANDLGLSLTCQYDLTNKSVSNTVDLEITGEITPSLYEEAIVDSPNVLMRVEDLNGDNTKTAVVGDPLSMIFEIIDVDSPYEIFVRDLVAVDGVTETELVLIDNRGCPADPSIMSELRKAGEIVSDQEAGQQVSGKILKSSFDAFRFPTSQMVQFRAMVTPCMPTCEPVQCDIIDYTGQSRYVDSYGRKKRWVEAFGLDHQTRVKRMTQPEEVLVMQTLRIVDKIGHRRKQLKPSRSQNGNFRNSTNLHTLNQQEIDEEHYSHIDIVESNSSSNDRSCIDDTSLIAGAIVFIVIQVLLLILWTLVWKKKRTEHAKEVILPPEACSSTDSLSYIYDSGIPRRLN